MEVISLTDINNQILSNASVLFPTHSTLRVITSQTPSGLVYSSAIVALASPTAVIPRYITVLQGLGANNRRQGMMNVLDETEKRISRERGMTGLRTGGTVGVGVGVGRK